MRLLLRIKRGGKRIDDSFASPIGQGEERHARVKEPIRRFLAVMREDKSRAECENRSQQMQHEGHGHQRPVAHPIREETEEDDGQPESPETTSRDGTEFSLGKAELPAPIVEDAAANGEPD